MLLEIGPTPRTRPDPTPSGAAPPTRKAEDLGWTLRLLRPTGLGISLFRLKLHGLSGAASARGFDLLTDRLADDALVQRLDDGSALLLVIRFEDGGAAATARLSARLAAVMRERGWPCHAVAELFGVHHKAAETGPMADLVTELTHAPRRLIDPGDPANG